MNASMGSPAGGQLKAKRDWGQFFGGLAVVAVGPVVVMWPGLTLVTLAFMAGVMLLAAGVFDVFTYFRMRTYGGRSAWALVGAACDIVLGAVFILFPLVTAAVIPWVTGAFVAAYGTFAIIAALRLRRVASGWGLMLANGIVAVVCGLLFAVLPESFVLFLGFFLMMRGVTMAVYGAIAPRIFPYV